MSESWLPVARILALIKVEPIIFMLLVAVLSWGFYKIFLRKLSEKRHVRLKGLFLNLFWHIVILAGVGFAFSFLKELNVIFGVDGLDGRIVKNLIASMGLLVIVFASTVFVKTARIVLYEYLFFLNMSVGVPVLFINLFTFLLSVFLALWLGTALFELRLAPLLATSAAFSIILGLALQDTLGNLFAGVALQFDKPFGIGDWVEIQSGGQGWVGQVREISWRATVLYGVMDEVVTLPNRMVAQSEISNYSSQERPLCRGISLKLTHFENETKVRLCLERALLGVSGVRSTPAPIFHLREITESWAHWRVLYFIDDFGKQFDISDLVHSRILAELSKDGISIGANRIEIKGESGWKV